MRTAGGLPVTGFQKLVVKAKLTDFRAATEVVRCALPDTIKPTEVLVQNRYVGVNASDVNFTAGVYKPGVEAPFDCGFEALGEVVGVGEKVTSVDIGDKVLTQAFGAFSEYQVVPTRNLHKVPSLDPRLLPLEVSGCTAQLALEHVAQPVVGETALVTAAAGGTGQFAVQLLKNVYGCKVIGTCSNDRKVEFLKELGCDRVINYHHENFGQVLKKEFPSGVNIVYESVGGSFFEDSLRNLSVKGRLVTIGSITGYVDGSSWMIPQKPHFPVNTMLLQKSASVRGFFLPHFAKHQATSFEKMMQYVAEGKVKSMVDPKPFRGVESIAAAVDYLHSKQNIGKVICEL